MQKTKVNSKWKKHKLGFGMTPRIVRANLSNDFESAFEQLKLFNHYVYALPAGGVHFRGKNFRTYEDFCHETGYCGSILS